jgi:hypothetical protein
VKQSIEPTARRVKLNAPTAVGVPLTTPVMESKTKPAGKLPATILNLGEAIAEAL